MDVIALAAEALEPLAQEGITVQQGWYDGSLDALHITLWKLGDGESGHSDDDCEVETANIQVNIWDKKDNQPLAKRVRRLMKKKGFLYTEGNDQIETDVGIFTNAMRFQIHRETEEMEE